MTQGKEEEEENEAVEEEEGKKRRAARQHDADSSEAPSIAGLRQTGVDGHDEKHVRCVAYFVRDGRRGCVWGDGDAGLHFALADGVD